MIHEVQSKSRNSTSNDVALIAELDEVKRRADGMKVKLDTINSLLRKQQNNHVKAVQKKLESCKTLAESQRKVSVTTGLSSPVQPLLPATLLQSRHMSKEHSKASLKQPAGVASHSDVRVLMRSSPRPSFR